MALEAQYKSLPFNEAIEFFRQKVRMPTRAWSDIHHGMHARAFVVAGATRDDLLSDFQRAIDKAIADGTTLEEFRKDFDRIVATYGWQYNGGRNWRSRVIYETNIRTAYMAGRYKQMTDPAMLRLRPYWQYRHGDSFVPRPDHLSWDGLVLEARDPWWQVHFPPNGWGCKCKVFSLSVGELKALGKDGPDTAPPTEFDQVKLGRAPDAPTVAVPKGVDPGWGYSVGEAAWGRPLAEGAIAAAEAKWSRLTAGDWRSFGRPEIVPADKSRASPGAVVATGDQVKEQLRTVLGGDDKVYSFDAGSFHYPVLVDAEVLGDHLAPARARYLPFLDDTITNPFEVWASFEKNEDSGLVALRMRFIKMIELESADRGVLLVAQAIKGVLSSWTFLPVTNRTYLNRQRAGKLIYGRD